MAFLAGLVLIGLTYYKWLRSLAVCIVCYVILPMETDLDVSMFFIVWAIFTTIICLPKYFWAGFGVGFLLGKR